MNVKRTVVQRFAHLFAAGLLVAGLTLGSGSAFAGAATDVVKEKQTALFTLIKGSGNDKKVADMLDEMLDYQTLSQDSLGTEWSPRTDAEKSQFTDLLKQLVRKSYEKNLKKIVGYDIAYTGEEPSGSATLVKTTAKSSTDNREDPISLGFKMGQVGGKWKVQDILTENVSLTGSYRSQFTKVIKKDGFPALLQKMKDKLAKGDV